MRTGGFADKLGNRYEGRWTAKQLLLLLAEKLQMVQLESEDAIEERADLFLGHRDGVVEAQQCKKNNSQNNWPITELARRGVLAGLHDFLIKAAAYRFSFISNREATALKSLIEKAREASGDVQVFRAGLDTHDKASWDKLCKEWSLSPEVDAGLHLLARAEVVVFDDGLAGQTDVETLAELLLDGDPRSAVLRLADFALERMGHPIHVEELRRFLHEQTDFKLRDLTYSPRIAEVIEACCVEFSDSIRRTLIQGKLIPRPETLQLHSAITEGKGPRIHCVAGGGGQGKTCVLHELTQLLARDGIPFLPLRFDAHPPRGNTRAYGQHLEFPESPVKCLHAVVGERLGVLLIDQLDALRWTPQHDPSAWTVFERLVTEAVRLSPTLHVVVACRTFDLEHDPQIRPWREQENIKAILDRVLVGDFPADYAQEVVEQAGGCWAALNPKQQQLLERPQCLYLWTNLPNDARSAFRTATDLMRAFWRDVRLRLEKMGLAPSDRENALESLVSRLDADGASTAPALILDRWPRVRDGLVSLHVIEELHGRKLRFAHQSYFDYYLAELWLARLRQKGVTITAWLTATDEQSLLRRGQLRQLLAMLRDDDATRFLNAVRELLHNPGIRFHLQHLTLQFLGNLPDPTQPEVACIVEFLQEEKLRSAVLLQVLYGHAQWFDAFDATDTWASWLASDEAWKAEIATRMLGGIATQRGDRTAQLMFSYADKPAPWPDRLRRALPWTADQDTLQLFQLRLRLFPNGVPPHPHFLFTEKLAQREPTWLIDLLASMLSRAQEESRTRRKSGTLARGKFSPFRPAHYAAGAVKIIAEAAPDCFWAKIAPFVVSAVAEHGVEPHEWEHPVFQEDALWQHDLWRYEHLGGQPLPAFLAVAGAHWARTDIEALLGAIGSIEDHAFQTIQQLVGTVWLHGPDGIADKAIGWLTADKRRFCLGHLGTKLNWRLAWDLIRRFAPLCTDKVYLGLEVALLSGDPAREIEHLKERLRAHLVGRSKVGFLRHALLPALPECRRSLFVINAIGQLQEKFRKPAEDTDQDSGSGGVVVSPITGRSARLSDRAWLRLIASGDACAPHEHRRYKKEHVVESSPGMFARDLGQQAELDPARFANLARQIPPDASPMYWSAILHAIALTKPPDPARSSWQEATGEQCCAVLRRVGYSEDRDVAVAYARCVRARHEFAWPDDIVAVICRIASAHSDPHVDEQVIRGDREDRLDGEAINTARGCAAEALANILFQRQAVSADAQSTIEHLVADPIPAIRVAAMGVVAPVLDIDRDMAVAWFLRACDGTLDQVLSSYNAQRFMQYAIATHASHFDDILDRMHRSSRAAVAELGAKWTTLVWLYEDRREHCFHECTVGSVAHRKGVADVLARHVNDERVAAKCLQWLPQFLNDSEKEVRIAATGFLRTAPNIATNNSVAVLRAFVASQAFRADPHYLVWELERHKGDLRPLATVIFEACDRLTAKTADPTEGQTEGPEALGELAVFLLRLYGQVEPPNDDPRLRRECLDRWDSILRNGNYIPPQVASFLD
jgi:hypothetical protein